jgi:hypothetical protein
MWYFLWAFTNQSYIYIYIYAHTNDISWLRNIHKKLSLYLNSTLTIRKLGSMSSKLNSITFFLKEFVSLTKENYKSQPELYIHIRFWQLTSSIPLCINLKLFAFQITFRYEKYDNNVFFIFKKLFLISTHQNNSKNTNHIKF